MPESEKPHAVILMRNIRVHLNGRNEDYIVRSLRKYCHGVIVQEKSASSLDCELSNITLCGAQISVPKDTAIAGNKLKITIPSAVSNITRDTVINSEIRWSDEHPGADHVRHGLMFTGMSRADRCELKQILLSLDSPRDARLPCHLATG